MAAIKMTADFREGAAVWATSQGNSLSLHTGDPGTTGANEISGGSYARVATTWTAGAVDGAVVGSEVEFNIPGPVAPATVVTPTHLGCWSGSTFKWAVPISNIQYPGPSKVRITATFSAPQG
ncbi:hypothetical protein [Rhodococcus sp. B10]|uniref:phage tail fiber protein n=1 Tax=Rhodococcus sp. B10 TaxID=2695876 RepID=UPI001430A67F|nr:hypothetical protein [Rhodococcus sp. B10]NIL74411.1 hypothetical protein [Rhodococcus sp. B10]